MMRISLALLVVALSLSAAAEFDLDSCASFIMPSFQVTPVVLDKEYGSVFNTTGGCVAGAYIVAPSSKGAG